MVSRKPSRRCRWGGAARALRPARAQWAGGARACQCLPSRDIARQTRARARRRSASHRRPFYKDNSPRTLARSHDPTTFTRALRWHATYTSPRNTLPTTRLKEGSNHHQWLHLSSDGRKRLGLQLWERWVRLQC